jgi:hypothetical protein
MADRQFSVFGFQFSVNTGPVDSEVLVRWRNLLPERPHLMEAMTLGQSTKRGASCIPLLKTER